MVPRRPLPRTKDLEQGQTLTVCAWTGQLDLAAPDGPAAVASARSRAQALVSRAQASDATEAQLTLAADQLIVAGPTVVAGYPWFGEWSRDTMTSTAGTRGHPRLWPVLLTAFVVAD